MKKVKHAHGSHFITAFIKDFKSSPYAILDNITERKSAEANASRLNLILAGAPVTPIITCFGKNGLNGFTFDIGALNRKSNSLVNKPYKYYIISDSNDLSLISIMLLSEMPHFSLNKSIDTSLNILFDLDTGLFIHDAEKNKDSHLSIVDFCTRKTELSVVRMIKESFDGSVAKHYLDNYEKALFTIKNTTVSTIFIENVEHENILKFVEKG
jgi:hypothetical protein